MRRYQVTEQEYNLILHDLRGALTQDVTVVFAYLHGSFLEEGNFGDIDIAAYVMGGETKLLTHELQLEQTLQAHVPYPVDVRLLNLAPLSFRYTVLKNGLKLVDKNEDVRVDFETATLRDYFDFLPFRHRYLREVLNLEI